MPANDIARGDVETLFLAFDQLLTIENPDAIVRRAVELARDSIGLVRVSIYVLDQCRDLMLGTWASDSRGVISDEHHVIYAMSDVDREAFRSDEVGAPYTVFEGALIVEHRARGTRVNAQGWIACTPIRCGQDIIGMMFNDAGRSDVAFDQEKQAQAAILCSLLGAAFGSLAGTRSATARRTTRLPTHRLVMATVAALAQDPGIRLDELARQLAVSPMRLWRTFEARLGLPLAEYRNRLRLDRVALLIAKGRTSLPDAVLAAGFQSYAHFQQVYRTFRWMALLEHRRDDARTQKVLATMSSFLTHLEKEVGLLLPTLN